MKLPLFQVDAFAEKVFEGNPAAVVPLDEWLDDEVLLAIAGENNLSETAFFVPGEFGYRLRWFTPGAEVDLCGHATLAAAHVLFEHLGHVGDEVVFGSRSGELLTVSLLSRHSELWTRLPARRASAGIVGLCQMSATQRANASVAPSGLDCQCL